MNDYIELYSKLFKKWIFPCRLFIPSSFGKTALDGRINNEFYIDFVSDVSIKYQTIYFKGYLAIGLKNDNGYLTSAIQLIESEPIFFSSTKGNTQYNGKYITWRDDAQSSPQLFFCDYKDMPRILYHEILSKSSHFKGRNMEKVAKNIIAKAKTSMLYVQSVNQAHLPSLQLYQIYPR